MTDFLTWPSALVPSQILANMTPFTRSGGRSLGGLERVTRTDRGFWTIDYKRIALYSAASRRAWNATRTSLGGMAGMIAVPVWSFDTNGVGPVSVTMEVAADIGDTTVALKLVSGITDLSGVRFSYQNALYETGLLAETVVADVWVVDVFPAIRAAIPEDAVLEFDDPTCIVRLADDRAMDVSLSAGNFDAVDVSFVEAVDYWTALAAES